MSEDTKNTTEAAHEPTLLAAAPALFHGSKQTTLFGLVKEGVFGKNPVFVLALSLCPAVAVTAEVGTAFAMGAAVLFVISFNNLLTSLFRKFINPTVRMPTYIVFIAALVTLAQLFMSAFFPKLYADLGVYLALIVVFAIILARAEVFASKNPPLPAFMDGVGMGLGFTAALVLTAAVRELFGSGTLVGYSIFGESYQPVLMIILAPGGFITIGLMIAGFQALGEWREGREAAAKKAAAAPEPTPPAAATPA